MEYIESWQMVEQDKPLELIKNPIPKLKNGEVLVKVSGCGVCHTDLSFYYDKVKTKSKLPLTLGHEISGVVIEADYSVSNWINHAVIIPAVMPCGECDVCKRGLGNICYYQKMPGNDINGGFASHIIVPAKYLCDVKVDKNFNPISKNKTSLAELSIVADALTTPYQAIIDSKLNKDDTAIFIGVGGVGGFGVQIAKAMGALVIAIDVNQKKLKIIEPYADAIFNSSKMSFTDLRKAIRIFVKNQGKKLTEWKIFETSGTASGQKTAFKLLNFGAYLAVIGYTTDTLNIRLSNLMAFHATAKGNWGCLVEYYPIVLNMILSGKINLKPFIKLYPISKINHIFERVHNSENTRRAILVP